MFTGDPDEDRTELARYAAAGADALAALPARPLRSPAEQLDAETVLTACRAARRAFLGRHAEAVYDRLTEGLTRRVRLPDLVYAAADRFPGLVPTRAQMAAEAAVVQAEKDGHEIDQGLFAGAVLRSPVAGRHLVETMLMPTEAARGLLADFRRTGRTELETVDVERIGHGAHLTVRNAHCLNAEDNRLIRDLETAVDLALLDDGVKVGVLRGGPVDHPRHRGRRIFSAGINLKDLRNGAISFVDFLLGRELGYVHKMLRGLLTDPAPGAWSQRTVSKPWVAAVDAFAIGGGMQLLLVMDRVIAEKDAYFSLPAAEEGIVPGLGNLRLTRLTGARQARRIILGGERIPAAGPKGELLCDEAVPAGEMADAVERAVRDLGAPAVAANRRMLQLAEEPLDHFRTYLAEFAVAQIERAYSDDVLAKVEQRWQRSRARG
ncbi:(3,5-dihydroxyphenyl)acetyl-CoA 1,2-dioxygenase DpgC [Streptomyces sp. NPDC051217]|uniref:(3,5-dihydroxyphenyl)acetyl-CoA 1,2-dioxygenase DpgC n=1 Tax=Streptomyces sp. NPDC051217 TaxID=3365644 RepID=UPI0037A1F3BF